MNTKLIIGDGVKLNHQTKSIRTIFPAGYELKVVGSDRHKIFLACAKGITGQELEMLKIRVDHMLTKLEPTPPEIVVGSKIYFSSEKRPYTVRACNYRFAICTKPFNAQKTVMYTIIDFQEGVRGTENLLFCMGFESDHDCKQALKRLSKGESEVSSRNRVKLDIVKIKNGDTVTLFDALDIKQSA